MDTRTSQLAEIWRVALARHLGQDIKTLHGPVGPLSRNTLTIYLNTLQVMLRGTQYKRAMKNADTNYFLTQIARDLGPADLKLALSAMEGHITYYNSLGKGELRGARDLHELWMVRVRKGEDGPPLLFQTLLAQEATQLAAAQARSPDDRAAQLATANPIPRKVAVTTTLFLRNQDVVAETLLRANGICEGCHQPAPFHRASDQTPYIEVHHRIPLAEGGHDTVANAIALCPNCHRQEHHGTPRHRPDDP